MSTPQRFKYCRPSDNLIATASPTITVASGSVESGYGSDYIGDFTDDAIGRPMRFTTTSARVVFDFGTPVAIPIVALWHNGDAGLDVRLQANASNVWTSPSFDAGFELPDKRRNGYFVKVWMPVASQVGYGASRYWSVLIPTNSVPVGLKLWLGAEARQLTTDFAQGFHRAPATMQTIGMTDAGVDWRYRVPSDLLRLDGTILAKDTTDAADLKAWFEDAGGDVSLLIPDPNLNEAEFVKWAAPQGSNGLTPVSRDEILEPQGAIDYRQVAVSFTTVTAGGPEWD